MRYINSLQHELSGYFNVLPVYPPLEEVMQMSGTGMIFHALRII